MVRCGAVSAPQPLLTALAWLADAVLAEGKQPGGRDGEQMRVRVLLTASIATVLVLTSQAGRAQQAPAGGAHVLPTLKVTAPKPQVKRRPRKKHVVRTARVRVRVVRAPAAPAVSAAPAPNFYPITPLASGDADKVPASVNVVTGGQIARTGSPNVTDALQRNVPGIAVNQVAGNPFMPNVQFRGFVASPVSGTPEGLAVYQNGVRINEAFGDTVNWDLIPTAAIRSAMVVTNNPAFGLNALGGAVDLQMKNGFTYHGTEIDTMGGSYGRLQGSAQWGKQIDDFAVYGAIERAHDDGFRNFSSSDIRRFYGDIGYRNGGNEFHLNMGSADNLLGQPASVPVELIDRFWGATYTTPQTTQNRVGYLNLTGKAEVTPSWTLGGTLHVRAFNQAVVDGNATGAQPCADPALLCFGNDMTPANGQNGVQLANPFPANAILGEIDRNWTRSTTAGASLEATSSDDLFGHANRFVVGSSFDTSVTHFNGNIELGTIGPNYVVSGSGIYLGQSGNPTSIGPVALRTTNQYSGLYALDTFDVTRALSITAGGRFNDARIALEDQIGTSLNGNDTFDRFNPLIGATYKITPELTAYAGYSEANRAPTPLELGCADPTHPCLAANFLVSDPPLKQVVSRTVEAGFRGTEQLAIGSLSWKAGLFRAKNTDDILAVPSPVLQGFGYFQNVGATRRQGIETEVSLKSSRLQLSASYAFVDSRFLNALLIGSNSPFAVNGDVQVLPGDEIPAIPRHRVKASIDYAITDALKVGGDALYASSQYFVGDESNQAAKLPGYVVFNLRASYQIDKTWQAYGRVNNLFDNRYATYGTFFETGAVPNLANGGAPFTDPRALGPAMPRAFYAGLKARF